MNDKTVNELKEFITLTISLQNKDLRTELLGRLTGTEDMLTKKFGKVHRHLGHLRSFIAGSLDTTYEATDAVLADYEARLFDLETDNDTSEDIGLFTTAKRQYSFSTKQPEPVS